MALNLFPNDIDTKGKLKNSTTPTSDNDIANKAYVDAQSGGGGGSTLTFTTTAEYTIDFTDIDAASGSLTMDAAQQLPANSRLVRIIWEVVTGFSYDSSGYTSYISSPGLIEVDGKAYIPRGVFTYVSYDTTYLQYSGTNIFSLYGAETTLNQTAPMVKIGSSAATPILKWYGWSNYYGAGSYPADAGSVKVSFEYLVIS
jgi:hypothetical protein